VAARIAAQGGKTEKPAYKRERAGNKFGRNSLQIGVAAIATMRVQGKAKRDGAGVEASFAGFAAPGQNFRATEKIVRYRAPLGAAYFGGAADRAGNRQGLRPLDCGQHRRTFRRGQGNVLLRARYNKRRARPDRGEDHGGIHGRARASRGEDEIAGARYVAEPISRVCDYDAIPGIFVDLPENGFAGLWHDHDPLHAKEGLHRTQGAENVFAGVPGFGNFL